MGKHTTKNLSDVVFRSLRNFKEIKSSGEIIVLESQLEGHPESVNTFIAAFPKKKLVVHGSQSEWFEKGEVNQFMSKPWNIFKRFRRESSWLFGYIGYDMKNEIEPLNSNNRAMYNAPDLFMMEPSILFRINNNSINQILGDPIVIDCKLQTVNNFTIKNTANKITHDDYIGIVESIKTLIKEGDFYELNYSYPFSATIEGDSYELYKKMRAINPVPFGSYFELDGLSICCSSPERFLKNREGSLMSEPIKGTSGRGINAEKDEEMRNELKSEKNKAENLMIVDLVRHDMAKISKPGSIHVSKLYDIQTFKTVHQLISRVEGEMLHNIDPVDAIKACFPMGSMTGAPKIQVMKRIEDLECYRRGIYSGSIGYFTPSGDFDFNVVIRTAIIQENSLTYPVGGAITGDSDPGQEWDETLIKAKVLNKII